MGFDRVAEIQTGKILFGVKVSVADLLNQGRLLGAFDNAVDLLFRTPFFSQDIGGTDFKR
jgi:hypothetical protein